MTRIYTRNEDSHLLYDPPIIGFMTIQLEAGFASSWNLGDEGEAGGGLGDNNDFDW